MGQRESRCKGLPRTGPTHIDPAILSAAEGRSPPEDQFFPESTGSPVLGSSTLPATVAPPAAIYASVWLGARRSGFPRANDPGSLLQHLKQGVADRLLQPPAAVRILPLPPSGCGWPTSAAVRPFGQTGGHCHFPQRFLHEKPDRVIPRSGGGFHRFHPREKQTGNQFDIPIKGRIHPGHTQSLHPAPRPPSEDVAFLLCPKSDPANRPKGRSKNRNKEFDIQRKRQNYPASPSVYLTAAGKSIVKVYRIRLPRRREEGPVLRLHRQFPHPPGRFCPPGPPTDAAVCSTSARSFRERRIGSLLRSISSSIRMPSGEGIKAKNANKSEKSEAAKEEGSQSSPPLRFSKYPSVQEAQDMVATFSAVKPY